MNLAALCPSWGRPHMAKAMEASFPCDSFFYLDEDDPRLGEYEVTNRIVGPTAPISHLFNVLWKANPGYDAYILSSDDCVNQCLTLVDTLTIRSVIYPDGLWVGGPSDAKEKDSFPTPILSRRWCEVLGYVACPMFLHFYIDTWHVRLAQSVGRFIDLQPTVTIEHRNPKTGKSPMDATFKRVRAGRKHERDGFMASFARYFDADLEQLRADIEKTCNNDVA